MKTFAAPVTSPPLSAVLATAGTIWAAPNPVAPNPIS